MGLLALSFRMNGKCPVEKFQYIYLHLFLWHECEKTELLVYDKVIMTVCCHGLCVLDGNLQNVFSFLDEHLCVSIMYVVC